MTLAALETTPKRLVDTEVVKFLVRMPLDSITADEESMVAVLDDLRALHGLSAKDRKLLARALPCDVDCAFSLQQLRIFSGLDLALDDDWTERTYRVIYRRTDWAPHTPNRTELLEDHRALSAFLAKLNAGRDDLSPLTFVRVEERQVGAWFQYGDGTVRDDWLDP